MTPNLKNAVISLVGMGPSYDSVDGVITNWDTSDPPSGITQPTQTEIDAEIKRLQAEYDSQEYARNRKAEYNALNQLELMSDDSINDTTTHKDAIVAIKAKWPKDNSGPV